MLATLNFDLTVLNANSDKHGCIHYAIPDGTPGYICSIDTHHENWKGMYPNGCSDKGERYDDMNYVIEKEPGIWECSGGNFHLDLYSIGIKTYNHWDNYITTYGNVYTQEQYLALVEADKRPDTIMEYGVCDNIEQVKSYYRACIDNPEHKFVISMMPVLKCNQPEEGGWRSHKWGQYIGTQELTTEYLYDEPLVEELYCFHIYVIK